MLEILQGSEGVQDVRYRDASAREHIAHSRFATDASGNTSRFFRSVSADRVYSDFFKNIALFGYFTDGKRLPALLTLAQNIRSACPGLNNALLQPDTLAFDPRQPLPEHRLKGLRHLRLRTDLRDETSQHYSHRGEDEAGEVGVGSHFWRDPRRPRHFFSTARKPATAAGGSPQGSRVEAHWACTGRDKDKNKTYGMKHETRQDVWNPQLLEIAVARHAPDDDPAAWAALAHQQRYEATHFSDPLLLPAVLHLGYTVSKHVLPTHLVEPVTEYDG